LERFRRLIFPAPEATLPSAEQAKPAPALFAEVALKRGTVGRIFSGDHHQVHDLTPEDVSKGIAEGRYLLVDVREPNEVAVEAYRTRSSFRYQVSTRRIFRDPEGKQVVFACRSGKRSVTASLAARPTVWPMTSIWPRMAGLEGCGACRPGPADFP